MNKHNFYKFDKIVSQTQMAIDKHIATNIIVNNIAEALTRDRQFMFDSSIDFVSQLSEEHRCSNENGQHSSRTQLFHAAEVLTRLQQAEKQTVKIELIEQVYNELNVLYDECQWKLSQLVVDVLEDILITMASSDDINYDNREYYGAKSYDLRCILDIIDNDKFAVDVNCIKASLQLLEKLTT